MDISKYIARVATLLVLNFAAPVSSAKIVEELIRVPVTVSNIYGKEVSQDILVTIFYDDRSARPLPVLILNHGRAAEAQDRASMGRAKYTANSSWFARLGFLVAIPTRIGYGESGGEDVEDSGNCGRKRYPPAYKAAVTQSLAVLDALRRRADTSKDRTVVVGQSFGGATAVAIAADNPAGVQAAINFAGGGGGNPKTRPADPCDPRQLKQMFETYGSTARTPTLWIYSENDRYFGPILPREWFDAFHSAGGKGEFIGFPPDGDDGHSLFTRNPSAWQPKVLEFLRRNGYAGATPLLKEP
jgi:pimeloyl-ACP methyl ester carboxylesterase